MNVQPVNHARADLATVARTARIVFGGETPPAGSIALAVPAPLLVGPAGGLVVARLSPAAQSGNSGDVRWLADSELLFGVVSMAESGAGDVVGEATETAYRRVFETMVALGYPVLVRAWNYLAGINGEEDGIERYRRFNAGRQQAFAAAGHTLLGRVPAACALGTVDGPLRIAFLASRQPMAPLENPRQWSAYNYPAEYGARSPTFSRAALLQIADCEHLFVSGTAAIVGHRSYHPGSVIAQAEETVTNLLTMIDSANHALERRAFAADQLDYVVYLRHADDLPPVRALLRARLGTPAQRMFFVQADVCRAELLVEIEASGREAGDA